MRIALTLGLLVALAITVASPAARAGSEIGVVVTGESWIQPQLVAQIETWLSQHGHSLVQLPADALDALKQCFTSNTDLSCARGVVDKLPRTSGVIYAGVDSKNAAGDTPDVTLTAYWFDKGHDAIAERKNCLRCTDQLLRTATDEILKKLVGGGDLGHLKLKSAPPGARISIDGTPIGVTPLDWDLPPGKHTIAIDKPGFKTASEDHLVQSNKSDLVVMTLAADDNHDNGFRLSPWIPGLVAVGGGVLLGVGIADLARDQDGGPFAPPVINDTGTMGLALAAGGAVMITGATIAYLKWSRSPTPTSTPMAAITGNSAYLGWLGRF